MLRRIYNAVMPSCVVHRNTVLPARHLRLCGQEFKNDAFFLASAKAEVARLRTHCGLAARSRILDVGCGVGRLPIGLLAESVTADYTGVDVDASSIKWCSRHLRHPGFSFQWINVSNRRYNPAGACPEQAFRFPFPDARFDIIYLYSVFSHMEPQGITAYLTEFRRMLTPSGTLFCTAFIEENSPTAIENPQDYIGRKWETPLHCVRYQRRFFESMLATADLQLQLMVRGILPPGKRLHLNGEEADEQSAIYASHAS